MNTLHKNFNIHQKKLTIIQSQPGFGKTVLLDNLYQDSRKLKKAIYISLTASDNNPIVLFEKIVLSLKVAQLKTDTSFMNQFDNISLPSLEPIIISMLDAFRSSEINYIFVDDVDLISNTSANKIISSFITNLADQFNLIVTCTKSPDFHYSDLLLKNQVTIINESHLKLTFSDVRKLFDEKGFNNIQNLKLEELLTTTDGWPLGIQFVLKHIKEEDGINLIIEDLQRGNKNLETYFSEKSYNNQSGDLKDFIHKISVVDEFHLSLCNDITQDQNAHIKLSNLITNNTFITTITHDHFKFHTLFLQFIRNKAKLALGDVGLLECSMRAANWLYNNNNSTKAIELTLKVGQFEIASKWIENDLNIFLKKGRHYDYIDWVQKLPKTFLDKYPLIRANYVLVLCFTKQFAKMQENCNILLAQLHNFDEITVDIIKRQTSLAAFVMSGLTDDIKGLNSKITHWLKEWGHIESYQTVNQFYFEFAMANLVKGFSCKCISLFDEGKISLLSALQSFKDAESSFGKGWATAILSVLYAKQGFHHEALQQAQEGLEEIRVKLGSESHLGYMLSTLISRIYYEYGELEHARKYIQNCHKYIKEQGSTDILIALFQTEYKLLVAEGLVDEGISVLKDGIKWSESAQLFRLKLTLVDDLITLLLLQKRAKEAGNYARLYKIQYEKMNSHDIDVEQCKITSKSFIYQLITQKKHQEAIDILHQLIDQTQKNFQMRQLSYWLLLMSIVHFEMEDKKNALIFFIESIEISITRKYIRMYVDEGQLVYQLLLFAVNEILTKEQHSFISLLLKHCPEIEYKKQTLIEPLTTKEKEIILKLEGGLPNKKVANELNISEGTLKWHLHNIYLKLNVKNRTQALIVAKENGYIHPARII